MEIFSAQTRNFWAFEKSVFQFFANFSVTKLKPFSGKLSGNVQNYLNQNLVKGSLPGNGFKNILSTNTNLLHVWKEHFKVFSKSLSEKGETIFGQSEAKRSKLFKSKSGLTKLPKKWFWRYLELKSKCFKRLNRAFSCFFGNIWVAKLKAFTEKVRESLQNYLNHNLVIGSFFESRFQATMNSKTTVLILWKDNFPLFCK